VGLVGFAPPDGEDAEHGAESLAVQYEHATSQLGELCESAQPPGCQDKLSTVAPGVDWMDAIEGVTPELVERWRATGKWPTSVESWLESRKTPTKPRVVYSVPKPVLTGMQRFLARCKLVASGRVEAATAYNVYRIDARLAGEQELPHPTFVSALRAKLVRPITMRVHGECSKGLAGLRLMG
jgi:hypothetical protein